MLVRGGDGALAHTRVVAPGCAGDGVSRAGKLHPHPACLHALIGYMSPCFLVFNLCHCEVMGGGAGGWGFFLCVFSGFPSLCPVFSSKVASRLFLPFWFARVGVRVGQWGV